MKFPPIRQFGEVPQFDGAPPIPPTSRRRQLQSPRARPSSIFGQHRAPFRRSPPIAPTPCRRRHLHVADRRQPAPPTPPTSSAHAASFRPLRQLHVARQTPISATGHERHHATFLPPAPENIDPSKLSPPESPQPSQPSALMSPNRKTAGRRTGLHGARSRSGTDASHTPGTAIAAPSSKCRPSTAATAVPPHRHTATPPHPLHAVPPHPQFSQHPLFAAPAFAVLATPRFLTISWLWSLRRC